MAVLGVGDELGRQAIVGLDAADLGRGDDELVDFVPLEEGVDGVLVEQVQLGVGGGEQLDVSPTLQPARDGAADHAAVAGEEACGHVV